MKSTFIFILYFHLISTCYSQATKDTLHYYFFLENRLFNYQESYEFMKFHIKPCSKFKQIKSDKSNKLIFSINSSYRYEQNVGKLCDLHRFYIDISCIKMLNPEGYLSIFATPKLSKKFSKIINTMSVTDTIELHNTIDNSAEFLVSIVNKKIISVKWKNSNGIVDRMPDKPRNYEIDTLPTSYLLHNRVLDCDAAYKYMQRVLRKRSEEVITLHPNDKWEKTKIFLDILAERSDWLSGLSPSSNKYIEFYIDVDCLKLEPPERVLNLFLTSEQTQIILDKVDRLKDTEYASILLVRFNYLGELSMRFEHGKITGIGWPIVKNSH